MRTTILAVFTALATAACNGTTAPANTEYESLPADQIMIDMTHNMTNGGIRTAHLKADSALMFNDSSAIQLRKVDLELYEEKGTVRATLTSERGSLDQHTNRMIARGNVVLIVKGENARTIYTEELHYDPNTKQVWSDVRIRMVFPDGRQNTADSFRSDDEFKNFRAENVAGAAPRSLSF